MGTENMTVIITVLLVFALIALVLSSVFKKQRAAEAQQTHIPEQKKEKILRNLIAEDKYVTAVKRARQMYGYSLLEAKQHVDELAARTDKKDEKR